MLPCCGGETKTLSVSVKKKSVILVRNALTPPPPLLTLPPLPENWQYIQTECADGWWPHNGFCYKLLSAEEAGSWEESGQACGSLGANLTSLHSLSEVEMLLKLLANCEERHVISTSVYHTHTHTLLGVLSRKILNTYMLFV